MTTPNLTIALGAIVQPLALQALNAEGNGGGSRGGPPYKVPEWIPLLPAGPLLSGVDGRVFKVDDPREVTTATRLPIVLDWDHASARGLFSMQPGKAAARIVKLDIRDDEMWGRCEWTEAGHASVEAGEYLYISPALCIKHDYESDRPPEVKLLTGAGLVNSPNFQQLPALNRQEEFLMSRNNNPTADPNATAPAAAPAAGQPEGNAAPAADSAANAPATEPASNASQPAATAQIDMVPRAELEAAMNNMNTLSQQMTQEREARDAEAKAQHDAAINAALDQAITDRKILPTSRDYYLTQCQAEGGLDAFKTHCDSLPQMLPDSGLDNAPQPGPVNMNAPTKVEKLTPKQEAFCSVAGVDPEKYLKTLQEDNAKAALNQGAAA